MDLSNLSTILEKTISPDNKDIEAAQQFLNQASADNLPNLLRELSQVLRNGGNSAVARTQAGLQLKNFLYSKDATTKTQYQQRWLALPEDIRNVVKENILATLGTETVRPSSAAQCVANVACAELPHKLWPNLIEHLTGNITNPESTEMMREATLETIGYICQDIDPELLQYQSNEILTAIVHGMKKEETSNHVRLAATNALLNSLEFTRQNFDRETERHFIMQVVCEATQSTDTRIRVAALQCLVKIMSLYYIYMEHYMGPALFAITMEAMKSDVDEIALQGFEFWSTVCDEEVDLAIELSEAAEQGKPPENTSRFYAKGALPYLIPILLITLTKQVGEEEFDSDDEWNPCKAAGVCLMLMATCCDDDIVAHVLPFVQENIRNQDWRFRDAAVMALGSIIEGPDPTKLKPLMEQAMPMLIELMKDPSVVVRDTTAWMFGRVCEILPDAVINEQFLGQLLQALIEGLQGEPRVASNVCWAFSSLAEAAYESAEAITTGDGAPDTFCLSTYFQPIVNILLQTTDRPDGNQHNLRNAAYEALMEMVKNSPKDCYLIVQNTTMIILERLRKVLEMESAVQSCNDRSQFNDLQSLLCATLQSVLRKVTPEDAPKISDQIMAALLQMLSTGGKGGGVQEDAILAVSILIEVLGEGFEKYVEAFKPFLSLGLQNCAEYQVCLASVGVVGDLSRALGRKILPLCDELMQTLLAILANDSVHRQVKPQILSVFGDIALAIGPNFKMYLEVVLNTLQQASQLQVDKSDYDMVDYLNEVREGCLEAYTGIVQGLKGDGEQNNADVCLLLPHVPHMISFIEHISLDEDKSDGNISACCGLIGDMCTAFGGQNFGGQILPMVEKQSIQDLLTSGRRSKGHKTKTLANWATKEIRKLKTTSW